MTLLLYYLLAYSNKWRFRLFEENGDKGGCYNTPLLKEISSSKFYSWGWKERVVKVTIPSKFHLTTLYVLHFNPHILLLIYPYILYSHNTTYSQVHLSFFLHVTLSLIILFYEYFIFLFMLSDFDLSAGTFSKSQQDGITLHYQLLYC